MSTKFDIEKFDGNMSFSLWRIKMKAILTHQGFQNALLGIENMPKTMSLEEKQEQDQKALSVIQLCLSNGVSREVAQEKTTAGLWSKLESLYMTKSLTGKLHLKQKFIMLRMSEGASIKGHIEEFNSIVTDLENVDIKIDDEDQALQLLCSLPPSYKHFRETLLYGRESITLKDVKAALLSKDILDKGLTGGSGEGQDHEAFVSRGRPKERSHNAGDKKVSRSKSRNKDKSCNYCKKKGHIKADCWKLQKKQQSSESNSSKRLEGMVEANVAKEKEVSEYVLSVSTVRSKDDWILDSGCTHHVTPYREFFSTYEPIDGGDVLMGNDAPCKIIGIGSIKIKM